MVRVLLVDDSPVFLEALQMVFETDPSFTVVGTARDGREAVRKVQALQPDLVAMDVEMPGMDGLEAVEAIMASRPTPILLITGDPDRTGSDWIFEAIRRGALDLRAKPIVAPGQERQLAEFREHARLLASVPVVYRRRRRTEPPPTRREVTPAAPVTPAGPGLVGIVSSTGGPAVLAELLGALPADFGLPIAIVQHLAPGFAPHLVSWLNAAGPLTVKLAESGERPEAGRVYLAPDGAHLVVDEEGLLRLDSRTPSVGGHRPSGTILLRSIARRFGPRGIGLVLTGMGSDGAVGLAELRAAGGWTAVQDEETCAVYGMPKAAVDLDAACDELPRSRLADALLAHAGIRRETSASRDT